MDKGAVTTKIDIEFLLNTPGTAVHCATEEEAKQFLSYMKKHYSEWCENWGEDETRIGSCSGDGIGYTFYWQDGREWRKDPLMFGSIRYIIEDGYDVRELWELVETKELSESDQPVESLFEGLM